MSLRVDLVDHGGGNLASLAYALEHVGHRVHRVVDPAGVLRPAGDVLLLPGVGAFGACMRRLRERGLEAALRDAATRGMPIVGICVGMQVLAEEGREDGRHAGLGLVPGVVERLAPGDPRRRVPHVGWARLRRAAARTEPLLDGLATGERDAWCWFSHAFALPGDGPCVTATADHGGAFAAIVRRGSVAGLQFHPEKSQRDGLALLANLAAHVDDAGRAAAVAEAEAGAA